jgi:hypothetical protein
MATGQPRAILVNKLMAHPKVVVALEIVLAAVRSLVNFSRMKASFGISGAVNVGTPFLRH